MNTPRTAAIVNRGEDLDSMCDDLADLSAELEITLAACRRDLRAEETGTANLNRCLAAKTAECQSLKEALERITESHARLEAERGSVVGTLTANARAALQDTP